MTRLSNRIQTGCGLFGLLQLPDLGHANRTCPTFAANRFRQKLPRSQQSLRLPGFHVLRHDLDGFGNQLAGFFRIPRTLEETRYGKIFRYCLLGVPEFFMDLR